ncbi:hypothetical protein [Spirosoma oryzicola]|uniref:hypothetical protein n=1 Tax=Spirosoma oryzicola TaxID=2898794 RepID=UPI001E3EDBBB|nr:hypothetical protein [Spirosoma oryzicola]UHG90087.1 hypothetical protein LQ777_17760 [Spirosoma oryzicola]
MSQSTLETLQDTLFRGLEGNHHLQRMALASIASKAAMTNVGPLDFLKEQFYQLFRAELAATPAPEPAVIEPAVISCPKCERVFKSQTALNGHGVARCTGKQPQNSSPVSTGLS